jgi:inorganic pyrophosphatase
MSAMDDTARERAWDLLHLLFKPHPWHGVPIGPDAPGMVTAYVEIVPSDTVKFEIDKPTGLLKVDRPQQFSNVCPTLYGFLPQTYCGDRVAALSRARTGRETVEGDGDPLDICILTENAFPRGDVLLQACPIGGLHMLDHDEADDKILAVLKGDVAFGQIRDIGELPHAQIDRLKHYFLTYKSLPGDTSAVQITHTYGREEAYQVIERSREDYAERFPDLKGRFFAALASR